MTSYKDGKYHDSVIAYECKDGSYVGFISSRDTHTVYICLGTDPFKAYDTRITSIGPYFFIYLTITIAILCTLSYHIIFKVINMIKARI